MPQLHASLRRIIAVFGSRGLPRPGLGMRLGAATLLAAASVGVAQAQATFSLRMTLEYKGGLYNVQPTVLPAGERVEVPVDPVGALRVYVRAISMPGMSGQALLDMQVYQPLGTQQTQLSAFTMPAYMGSANTADMKTVYGDLKVNAYVDNAAASGIPGTPGTAGTAPPVVTRRPPAPVFTPAPESAPVRPQALPAPLPSPLPPPGN